MACECWSSSSKCWISWSSGLLPSGAGRRKSQKLEEIQTKMGLQWNSFYSCFLLPDVTASLPNSAVLDSHKKQWKMDAVIIVSFPQCSAEQVQGLRIWMHGARCKPGFYVIYFCSLMQFLAGRYDSKRRKRNIILSPILPLGKSLQCWLLDYRQARVMSILIFNNKAFQCMLASNHRL